MTTTRERAIAAVLSECVKNYGAIRPEIRVHYAKKQSPTDKWGSAWIIDVTYDPRGYGAIYGVKPDGTAVCYAD
jgi:glutamate-1-semialdehyde aminotransferase